MLLLEGSAFVFFLGLARCFGGDLALALGLAGYFFTSYSSKSSSESISA